MDPRQFAFEIQGLILGFHHSTRLLGDDQALDRARSAFEAILERRPGSLTATHPAPKGTP